jgi:hypothetical protein
VDISIGEENLATWQTGLKPISAERSTFVLAFPVDKILKLLYTVGGKQLREVPSSNGWNIF